MVILFLHVILPILRDQLNPNPFFKAWLEDPEI